MYAFKVYEKFFSNEGEPLAVYVLITGKINDTMFGVRQLRESVRVILIVALIFMSLSKLTNLSRYWISSRTISPSTIRCPDEISPSTSFAAVFASLTSQFGTFM